MTKTNDDEKLYGDIDKFMQAIGRVAIHLVAIKDKTGIDVPDILKAIELLGAKPAMEFNNDK